MIGKALATLGIWAAPAFVCWAASSGWPAFAFFLSMMGTAAVWDWHPEPPK
jgi:hypothetical protein